MLNLLQMTLLYVWLQIIKRFISALDATEQKPGSLPSIEVQVLRAYAGKTWGVPWKQVRLTFYQQAKSTAGSFLQSTAEGLLKREKKHVKREKKHR